MRLTRSEDNVDQHIVFTLEISHKEFLLTDTSAWDRALIEDCEKSGRISDILLGLETIVRRIEEAEENPTQQEVG